MKRLVHILSLLTVILLVIVLGLRVMLGGGQRLEDRTGDPILPGLALEVVADLEFPPGNIAVSRTGRVFFTLHPDGKPPHKVVELIDGEAVPYPNLSFQTPAPGTPRFDSVLSLRIDRQDRLWTLDFANFGRGQPRLVAFDLATNEVVHQYDFPSDVAGLFSMLNDLQIDPKGQKIYIAETSPVLHKPALIVYDTETRESRRVLEKHHSVVSADYIIQAPGRDMTVFGIATLRIPVDSIALDKQGTWLYYGPVTGDRMYRVATRYLNDPALPPAKLAAKVEDFGPKTLSDGLTMDVKGNIYLSDMEHSAILILGPDRELETLLKDPRLRWPDGFSFGPDGWLYVTCSALHQFLFKLKGATHVRANAPYQIFRFKPRSTGFPGH